MVKRQAHKSTGQSGIALHHAKLILSKVLRHQLTQQSTGQRRQLARLEHDAVAGGKGRDGGRQRQLQGIVPGRHHTHHAQRLALQVRARGQQVQGRRNFFGFEPTRQRLQGVRQQRTQQQFIGYVGQLGRTHAEVSLDRCRHGRSVFVEQSTNAQQAVTPQSQRHGHVLAAGPVLGIKECAQGDVRRVLVHD